MPLKRGMPRAPSIYGGCRLSITSIPTPPIMRCASIRPYIACLRGGYIVSRYADCVALYKDTSAFYSDKKREFAPKYGQSLLYEHHTTSLVFNDPPLHTRVRRIIAGAFTPRAIADMEVPVTRLVDGLIEAMAAKGSADPTDARTRGIPPAMC